jgi:hypothetical protein
MAKRGRNDPYKGFNFQVAFGAALAAMAGFALVKKLMPGVAAKYLNPNDYVADVPATGRPIEGVGTTVSPLPPTHRHRRRRRRSRRRSAVRASMPHARRAGAEPSGASVRFPPIADVSCCSHCSRLIKPTRRDDHVLEAVRSGRSSRPGRAPTARRQRLPLSDALPRFRTCWRLGAFRPRDEWPQRRPPPQCPPRTGSGSIRPICTADKYGYCSPYAAQATSPLPRENSSGSAR